jgi:Zn-dependent peptidase ImmA (M78 family)
MKAPKLVHVAPFDFAIRYNQELVDTLGAMGMSSLRNQIVVVGTNQMPVCERDTVLHELLHMCVQQTPLFQNSEEWAAEEERFVAAVTPRLLAMLRSNPKLVAYLVEKV